MDDQPNLDPEFLDELAEEFTRRIRRGGRPLISEYQQLHPDHAEEIADFLRSVAALESYREEQSEVRRSSSRVHNEVFALDRLGDYRIIGELGRGGMGLVLEAVHDSLGRRVAIKVLPQGRSKDRTQLARFQREARAAARLHHPHIVPVFGVGESCGYAYYVMELVRGRALNEVLQQLGSNPQTVGDRENEVRDSTSIARDNFAHTRSERSERTNNSAFTNSDIESYETSRSIADERCATLSPQLPEPLTREHFHWVARIGCQVASAMSYAHTEGVFHRDIKPSNLLLNQQDQVLITDFGLAKHSADAELSSTGEVVGTPRYMPPEVLEGTADERSDVYGLGITLYELLLLRPAYTDAPPAQVMRAILDKSPPVPRRIHASIPRDLETVVMKAIERDPAKRYRSAGELEQDLRRYLDDRPILARRASIVERSGRWARRNPAVASLTAVAFVLLAGIAAVFAVANMRLTRAFYDVQEAQGQVDAELVDKQAALERAEDEKRRAETNVDLAMQAFERVMDNIARRRIDPMMTVANGEIDEVSTPSTLTAADVHLLETLLEFFDRFAIENHKDFREESAYARCRVGDIQQQLGRYSDATRSYQAALSEFKQLAEEQGELDAFVLERVRVLNELARNASWQGSMTRASLYSRSARDLLEEHSELLVRPEGKFELAQTCWLFASAGARSGLTSMLEVMVPRSSRDVNARNSELRFLRGARPQLNERQREIVATLRTAVEQLTILIEDDPENIAYRISLARCYREQARILEAMGMSRLAARGANESTQILLKLVDEYPDSLSIKYELLESLCVRIEQDRFLAQRTNRAERLSGELSEGNPALVELQILKGTLLRNQGFLARRRNSLDLAADKYSQAVKLQQSICEQQPTRVGHYIAIAQTLVEWVRVEIERGNLEVARDRLNDAIGYLEGGFTPNRSIARVAFLRPSLQRLREWRRRFETRLSDVTATP